ncbi:MAG: glycoside hydrolase family 15 protein [Methanosarcina sp.]|nr:glycoside hydrolase family 15 protein [Methanosarcina sp.]MDD3874167.1 glycoside hydrolase family 15 protein [Methanosarcina sp.]MDD4620219.1 glycoside hydrolase family 15 protein [Methanosarcina sp.]HHV24278.1 glycoside hydrolase family 15 protein [Methanosarcina sp.]
MKLEGNKGVSWIRPLIFGNGRILICEDEKGTIRDIYFPYVGLENHGNSIKVGICDLDSLYCSWLENWKIQQRYKSEFKENFCKRILEISGEGREVVRGKPDNLEGEQETPDACRGIISNIGETVFENPKIGLRIMIWEAVHPSVNIFYRTFEVRNISNTTKHLRLFSNQNYRILETKIGETAVIDKNTLIHYKRDRYFLHSSDPAFDQHAVGTAEWKGLEGTWKDMESDAFLSGNPVAHGSVDSTLGWTLPELMPGESAKLHYWIVLGKKYCSVLKIHKRVKKAGRKSLFHLNFNFWNSFTERVSVLPEFARMSQLPQSVSKCFYRSLLAVVAHMDITGSIIASCDSDIKQFGADLYTYCWPRDAAWVCLALDRARYHHLTAETFEFFSKTITPRGNFLHKYTPAGDFGSTWHPVPMIQIDETGLPLYALYNNWEIAKSVWTTGRYYRRLVIPTANYLIKSIDKETDLPTSSFDLWEERKGVHTYSACTVYAGLNGAYELSRSLGDYDYANFWKEAADRIRKSILEKLYDGRLKRFRRALDDPTLDSSVFAVWYFGILPPDDPRVVRTMEAIERELKRPSGGFARYFHDTYFGYMNSWIICTLWLSQWHSAVGNLDRALELLEWCAVHAHPTGLLSEQIDDRGRPLSVLPLSWSHSAYVLAVLEYLQALEKKEGGFCNYPDK